MISCCWRKIQKIYYWLYVPPANTSIYANSSCIKFMVAIHFNGHLTETCWTQCKDKIIYFYNSQFVFVSKYEVKLVRLLLDVAVSNQFQLFNSFQCYWLVIQKSIWTNRFYYFYCFFCTFECSISNMHTSWYINAICISAYQMRGFTFIAYADIHILCTKTYNFHIELLTSFPSPFIKRWISNSNRMDSKQKRFSCHIEWITILLGNVYIQLCQWQTIPFH